MKLRIATCGVLATTLAFAAIGCGQGAAAATPTPRFQTSDRCLACHNDLHSAGGEDVSIGSDWQVSLMANSSRDPYWQASVRRETLDHAASQAAIEDECAACHMPSVRYDAKSQGRRASVFAHLPLRTATDRQAADGVSCSVCHQLAADNLGIPATFNGEFLIAEPASGVHTEFGPFAIDAGLQQVMRTSTGGFEPRQGEHIRKSELCASCHTLITKALDAQGNQIGALPEQVPYQEWLHSDLRYRRSCQSCHMPAVSGEAPVTRVLGVGRPGVARHEFVAANFLLQRIFGAHHDDFDTPAPAALFNAAAARTIDYLRAQAAEMTVSIPELRAGRLEADVTLRNLGGHKFPTAFPSRRAWLHVVVRDRDRHRVFESGALHADGSIEGNDNDADAARFEPHYREIRSADQVQIYEAVMHDANGAVTTGLLSAVGYLKDNRLLPQGFDKETAAPDIAVRGSAAADPGFNDLGHRLRYSIDVGVAAGPFEVEAELWYQPVGFRWVRSLKSYDTVESQRFSRYFEEGGASTAVMLVRARAASR